MSLPADFWEEFDRRLDAILDAKLEQKLEQKFEEKLAPLRRDIKKLQNWTARQDRILEAEMQKALIAHLQERKKGYIVFEPIIFPRVLQDTVSGKIITEFDGIAVLTNDQDVRRLLSPVTRADRELSADVVFSKSGVEAILVIQETKQDLTLAKLEYKIRQRELIEKYMAELRERGSAFQGTHIQRIGLMYFAPRVGLYIGGQEIAQSVKERIRGLAMEAKDAGSMFGYMELNGSRFTVADPENDYGQSLYGGRRLTNRKKKQ